MTDLHQLSTYPSSLGDRLRCQRREKGWTQEQLAAKADTSQAVIQKIENGRSLRPRKIDALATALEVTPSWLLFGDEHGSRILSTEEQTIAGAWALLPEPHRSRIRSEILQYTKIASDS
ncbi:hypothetical protein MNBD_GAMMA26-39 [hydrothermal vent metagenome]|uniref:HTH cro/C1-type domain-containing protein n=1 Tax=hydrothermal vent metagenome TaxID=652676 RepID=A0A3B1BHT9_9ZZZZ